MTSNTPNNPNILSRRTILLLIITIISLGVNGQSLNRNSVISKNFQFINGHWFNGTDFTVSGFYTVNGIFTRNKPVRVDSVIDLAGKYIVPPFAEAHNHNIDGFRKVEDRIHKYLADGIFYVKNPNSIPRYTVLLRDIVNNPKSIDIVFANGGLTSSGGHPLEFVKRNIGLGIFTQQDAEGGMYYVIDNEAELEQKWNSILKDKPDFIKTFLLYSEEYAKRKDDTAYFGWKGLNPALLPAIVKKAHASGLRVSTHIETAADFHNALIAGVDEINHLPGFRADSAYSLSKYFISEADAKLAKAKGTYVVTTLEGSYDPKQSFAEKQDHINKENLKILKKFHVLLAVGSDEYRKTSVPEVLYLSGLGVFSNLELLKIWCENTPMDIFPKRKIGFLKEGFEASFIVLNGNPIEDFKNVQKIQLRVKQGEIIKLQ